MQRVPALRLIPEIEHPLVELLPRAPRSDQMVLLDLDEQVVGPDPLEEAGPPSSTAGSCPSTSTFTSLTGPVRSAVAASSVVMGTSMDSPCASSARCALAWPEYSEKLSAKSVSDPGSSERPSGCSVTRTGQLGVERKAFAQAGRRGRHRLERVHVRASGRGAQRIEPDVGADVDDHVARVVSPRGRRAAPGARMYRDTGAGRRRPRDAGGTSPRAGARPRSRPGRADGR